MFRASLLRYAFTSIIFTAMISGSAYSAPTAGSRIEVVIPIEDISSSTQASAGWEMGEIILPSWVEVLPLSELGPLELSPGNTKEFTLSLEYKPDVASSDGIGEIQFSISASSAVRATCQLHTKDYFSRTAIQCSDPAGSVISSARLDDYLPPSSDIEYAIPPYVDALGSTFIQAGSSISIRAVDPDSATVTRSGVASTFYRIDFIEDIQYSHPFMLAPGEHVVEFHSWDLANNAEAMKSVTLKVDGMPPTTTAHRDGFAEESLQGNVHLEPGTLISFSAVDPGPGFSAGLSRTLVQVDGGDIFESTGALALSNGLHRVEFLSIDNVENTEPSHVINAFVGIDVDSSPPVSILQLTGAFAMQGSAITMSTGTIIRITSSDSAQGYAAGLAAILMLVDLPSNPCGVPLNEIVPNGALPQGTCGNPIYSSTFTLSAGTHTIEFFGIDKADNAEAPRRFFINAEAAAHTDSLAPRSALLIEGPASTGDPIFIATSSRLALRAIDDVASLGDGLGSAVSIHYSLDRDSFSLYASSISISSEGIHSLAFYGEDASGNLEPIHYSTLAVDATTPLTQLSQNGAEITLTAIDPDGGGVHSGVARIRYIVDYADASSCDGVPEDTGAARGTCANPWYGGPFSLLEGGHDIAFQAYDAVGNIGPLHSEHVNVGRSGPPSGGKGIGKDSFDTFWTVLSAGEHAVFAHADSSGVFVASAPLANSLTGLPWAVFFDTAGRAYAVGSANQPGTQVDVAVYKASPSGDAIESIATGDGGSGNGDFVFDAVAPGWITGAAQSDAQIALGLWKFDPALGSVQLATASARAGFDVASGIAVDADGSLWLAGYSQNPDASSGPPLDLALWHLAADGRSAVGGPFYWPGYLSDFDGGTTAKVLVTASAVYVAAPRAAAPGRTDMALVRFDKASGRATAEKIWKSADGDSSYPSAILPEAGGVLVAGGIGSDMTDAALWRFGYDGAFISATTADAGGARGAVFKGSALWLSVEGSTSPYQVIGETAAPGAAVDISTPAPADSAPPSLTLTPPDGSTATTASPTLLAVYSDALSGVSTATVRLFLDGVDVTSRAAVSASSAAFVAALAQGTHTATAQVADLAGNRASASSAFLVDSVAPATTLLVDGLAVGATALTVISTDALSFAAADAGTGVLETLYAVDGASETVFTAAFFLSTGTHALAFRSRDRAGNLEEMKTVALAVRPPDTTPPLVRLDFPGGLGVEQAVGGVVDVRGAVADESALAWILEAAPGAPAASGFAAIASGTGNVSGTLASWNTASLAGGQTLRLSAVDAYGNTASTATTVYVGNPAFEFAVGRRGSDVIVDKIRNPTGIAVRPDGLIWVASADKDELILLTPSGGVAAVIGEGTRGLKNPQGLAVDVAGSLYVADKGNDRVLKLSPDGSRVLLHLGKRNGQGKPLPGSGPGELKQPWDVAVDGNGDIYAADSGNRRIQVFDSSGNYLRQFGQDVLLATSVVRGIALTTEGLWVSDDEQERIFLFSRSGALIKSIGASDSAAGELSRALGLAADRLGALYVIEPNRDRVQKFDPRGKGLLAFGSKAGLTLADKQAKRYLTLPMDAAVAPDGSLWVTDTGGDRIIRYALPTSAGHAATGRVSRSSSVERARRVVSAKDGAKVERDDGAGVSVPKGALAADLEITVEAGDENLDKEQKTAKRREMRIQAVSDEVQYGPEGTTFASPVTLTLPYDANALAAQGLKEDDLKVYYWNPALKEWQAMPSTVDKRSKTVNAQTTHFSVYQVGALGGIGVAALDDFGLRDGYAFPNPSRDGASVTFRLQPGSADSIEVRVYDLSGRRVHSSSDFRFRGAFDDGNGKGAQNTYDHTWDVSGVGSGVYTFVMTAKKAGQSDIRKTGKIGVIR